jgi:hypothetical protein
MGATEILKTRVTPEMKARVGEITQGELITEAVWLRRLVSRVIQQNCTAPAHETSEGLFACLHYTEGRQKEHLIVGDGIRHGSTTEVTALHQVIGSASLSRSQLAESCPLSHSSSSVSILRP